MRESTTVEKAILEITFPRGEWKVRASFSDLPAQPGIRARFMSQPKQKYKSKDLKLASSVSNEVDFGRR
jgi:hypothetical protein